MSAEVETGGEAGWLKKKGTKRTAAERQEREREREKEKIQPGLGSKEGGGECAGWLASPEASAASARLSIRDM